MKTQKGRSMIEMLGVLAIIGVLSIGGLAGYTRAMNSYQATQIMDYMNRCSIAMQEKLGNGGTPTTCATDMPGDTVPVSDMTATYSNDSGNLKLTTNAKVPTDVCTLINGKTSGAFVNDVKWSCSAKAAVAIYKI